MARLLSLLIAIALVMTNSAALAAATCRHGDAQAHAHARQSHDPGIAAAAHREEIAAAATSKKAALADAAAAQLAGFLVPPAPALPAPRAREAMPMAAADAAKRPGRAIAPLLEPPAA